MRPASHPYSASLGFLWPKKRGCVRGTALWLPYIEQNEVNEKLQHGGRKRGFCHELCKRPNRKCWRKVASCKTKIAMGRAKRRVSSIADGFRNIEKRGRKGGNFPFLIIYLCSRNVHELIFLACLLSWLVYLELNRVWDILTGIRIAKDMSNFDLLKSGFASLTQHVWNLMFYEKQIKRIELWKRSSVYSCERFWC